MAPKKKQAEIEVLPEDLEINMELFEDDGEDDDIRELVKWSKDNNKSIGEAKISKGLLFGKKMVHWDVTPRCDPAILEQNRKRVETLERKLKNARKHPDFAGRGELEQKLNDAIEKEDRFLEVKEICELDARGRCPYKENSTKFRNPKCSPVDRMMRAHRQEVFYTYMDLDQDSYNKIGLELLPMYVIQCRLNILITAQPIMHASGSGAKSSPLLKELRNIQVAIGEIRSKLDVKLEKLRQPNNDRGSNDPLRGKR